MLESRYNRHYEELYKRWKRWKRRKYLKRFFLYFLFFLGVGFLFFKDSFYPKVSKNIPPPSQPTQTTQEIILTPSLSFENSLNRYLHYYPKPKPKPHKTTTSTHTTTTAATPLQPSPSQLLELESKQEDIQTLIEKFKIAPSKELALLIAREFYHKQNYPQTVEWSMKANEFDKRDEESWILFAKAVYKMGDRKKALNALKLFVQKSGSKKAQELLASMYKGEFK